MFNLHNDDLKFKGMKYFKIFGVALIMVMLAFAYISIAEEKEEAKEKKKDVSAKKMDKNEEFYRFVDVFNEVYQEIQNKYVEDVPPEDLFQAAINGMFMTLDTHSQFLDPDSLSQLEKDTEGEFSGIGIHITIDKGVLTVVAPIPGSPSAKLGIQPWDRIVEIEGESTKDITLTEAVKKLTGPPGTKVTITIYRENETEPLYYTITRETIQVQSVYSMIIDKEIGYARLAKFSENAGRDLRKVLIGFKGKGIKGLILDLRYNSGGLLKEAVDVSELFVPKGEMIVSTKGRIPNQNSEYRSKRQPLLKVPMIVLVNQASASASEIVAGALKDLNIAVIVAPKGQKTYGKGSVQTIEDLQSYFGNDDKGNPKKCAIRLTTAKYYTPSGVSIHGIGISPDIEIPVTLEQEKELAKHGLLGEPAMDEDLAKKDADKKSEDKSGDEEKSIKTDDSEPSKTLDMNEPENNEQKSIRKVKDKNFFYLDRLGKKKDDKDEFHDVLLDEGVKILKAVIIIDSKKK